MIRHGTTADEKVKKLKSQRQREIIHRLTGGPRSCRAQGPGRGAAEGTFSCVDPCDLGHSRPCSFFVAASFLCFFLILFFFVVTVVKCKNGLLDRF